MLVEEQEQVQHILQAALSGFEQKNIESLLETIDIRLYSNIFQAALTYIHEHPQPVSNGIRYLVRCLESHSASYTAEDIRDPSISKQIASS